MPNLDDLILLKLMDISAQHDVTQEELIQAMCSVSAKMLRSVDRVEIQTDSGMLQLYYDR